MQDLVYPHERTLGTLTLILGILAWLLLVVGTFGVALVALGFAFIAYLFAQSTLIAWIKGNGVELTAEQFPDLHAQFVACCDRLQIAKQPAAYVLNGNGGLNAFATKFLGHQYVVLYSDVVDAMKAHPDGVRFYIGHELGHLRMKHLSKHFLRWPVLWLPLLGAAYSRARETTCDRHGLACSGSPEGAARSLAALSAGSERWQDINLAAYRQQVAHSSGFWMSFHELTAGYPWLTKRVARVLDAQERMPGRNPLAYLIAAFVPYAGRLGGGFGLLILVYILAVLAAIALPAYQDYQAKAVLSKSMHATEPMRDALGKQYETSQEIPDSLAAAGLPTQLDDDTTLELDSDGMVLTVNTKMGSLIFTPRQDDSGHIVWRCSGGDDVSAKRLPAGCTE
jgi:Zn-dependent protease with chaperone function/Tfp pilus assembly major pilin PilA